MTPPQRSAAPGPSSGQQVPTAARRWPPLRRFEPPAFDYRVRHPNAQQLRNSQKLPRVDAQPPGRHDQRQLVVLHHSGQPAEASRPRYVELRHGLLRFTPHPAAAPVFLGRSNAQPLDALGFLVRVFKVVPHALALPRLRTAVPLSPALHAAQQRQAFEYALPLAPRRRPECLALRAQLVDCRVRAFKVCPEICAGAAVRKVQGQQRVDSVEALPPAEKFGGHVLGALAELCHLPPWAAVDVGPLPADDGLASGIGRDLPTVPGWLAAAGAGNAGGPCQFQQGRVWAGVGRAVLFVHATPRRCRSSRVMGRAPVKLKWHAEHTRFSMRMAVRKL